MSTSSIGSNVAGFNVLFPSGEPAPVQTTGAASQQNVYQQTAAGIESWSNSYLLSAAEGNGPSTLPLYTGGESVDSFAQLATELGKLGSTIDTTA